MAESSPVGRGCLRSWIGGHRVSLSAREDSRSRGASGEAGEIRIRNLIELAVVFLVASVIFQIAPVVVTRVNFLTELDVIAHSPVQETEFELSQKVLRAAEGRSIVLNAERVHVRRDPSAQTTTIDVSYELYLNLFARYTYVWRVNDHIEALLF